MAEKMVTNAVPQPELPMEILEHVLSRLPLESIFRFRAVCKRWNDIADSPCFRASCFRTQAERSYLLSIPNTRIFQDCRIFNTTTGLWSSFRLDFLHDTINDLKFTSIDRVATDRGLLCVLAKGDPYQEKSLIVCNPMTKECQLLNDPLVSPPGQLDWPSLRVACVLAMQVNQESKTFCVYVVADGVWADQDTCRLHIYDSSSESWRVATQCSIEGAPITCAFVRHLFVVLFYGHFDLEDDDGEEDSREVWNLATYNNDYDVWEEFSFHIEEAFVELLSPEGELLVINERLFFVGSSKERATADISTIHIIEVDFSRRFCCDSTIERAQMPDFFFNNLFKNCRSSRRFRNWSAISHGNSIVFNCKFGGHVTYDVPAITHTGRWEKKGWLHCHYEDPLTSSGSKTDLKNQKGWTLLSPSVGAMCTHQDADQFSSCLSSLRFSMNATVNG